MLKIKKQNQIQVQRVINSHSTPIVCHHKDGDYHVISNAHAYSKPFQRLETERFAKHTILD